ncbi:MAG: hypothetical protein JJ902_23575 [Roseibium sp.]|nr:hypothetical protein [Roseibium sp.]
MTRYSDAEIARVKDKTPVSEVISPFVTWDKAKSNFHQGDYWACCPFHVEATPSFHCDDKRGFYKCFGCGATGDQIRFLQDHKGLTFEEAMAFLGEAAEPEPLSPEQLEADRKARAQKRAEQDRAADQFRQREIRRAAALWGMGGRVALTEGAGYLRARGLVPCPVPLPLRFHPHFDYWHQRPVPGRKKPELYVLFSGPVMMAPITGPDGAFSGVHLTWIDPARPGNKIKVPDPYAAPRADGTPSLVAPKKIRGSKSRASIKLRTPQKFDRLVIGEGWETTASVLIAEAGTPLFDRTAYWASISLQAMGGKALTTVDHPSLKNKAGRPLKVPGPEPDRDDPKALLIPDCVAEVVRLGDGDSDRFTAEQVMARSARRWARPGRRDATAWAPEGSDFNDVLQGLE